MSFVRAANPIWYMVDLTGLPLNDNYYAFFLTNDLPYIPQAVYQDPNGILLWPNPIEFGPDGCLPNNIYFDPNLVYRIEIRRGSNQSDPLIRLIENFVPGIGNASEQNDLLGLQNLVTNPQFADIDFESPLTYTQASPSTYTVDVGPGWQLILTGAGTTVLTQVEIAGSTWNTDVTGNAPYALQVNNTGWTSAKLVQTFSNNGEIFSNGAISMSVTAIATTSAQNVSLSYVPSGSSNITTVVLNKSISTGVYTIASGAVDLPPSLNSDSGMDANIQMVIALPGTGILTLTNAQFIGQSVPLNVSPLPTNQVPLFQEISYERIVDQEFHIYKEPIFYKPIPSYLAGWDFPLNPAQLLGNTVAASAIGANKSKYVWDQTIIFQSANSGVGITRGSAGELVLTAAATTQAAVIQYLPQAQARKLLNDAIAVNLSAKASNVSGLVTTISLWYTKDGSLPSTIGSNNSLVLTLDANGKPATFNGNWIEIPRTNIQNAKFTVLPSSTTNFNDYNFNGWNLDGDADVNLATFFAIVIGTASITMGDTLNINSVGLMSGDIATRPAPQTVDDVLRECQYYYEKSYASETTPGTVTAVGQQFAVNPLMISDDVAHIVILGRNDFILKYKQTKITAPTVSFYSPASATADRILVGFTLAGSYTAPSSGSNPVDDPSSHWTATSPSLNEVMMIVNDATTIARKSETIGDEKVYQGRMLFHYVADSRLGA